MKVIDSDFIIEFLKNEARAVEKMQKAVADQEDIVTTVMNAQEVLAGALGTGSDHRYNQIEKFLKDIPVLSYEFGAAPATAKLHHHLKKKGTPIGEFDTIISGICLVTHSSIITRNVSHFKQVPLLEVESW